MDINSRLAYAVCALVMCLLFIPGQTDSSAECVKVCQLSEEMMSEFQKGRVNLSILTQQLSTVTLQLATGTQELIKEEKRKRAKATVTYMFYTKEMISEIQEVRVNLSILTQQLSTLTLQLTTGNQDLIKEEKRKMAIATHRLSKEEIWKRAKVTHRLNKEENRKMAKATHRLNKVIDAERLENIKLSKQLKHCLNSNNSCDGCSQPAIPSYSQTSRSEKFINGGHKSNISYSEVIQGIQQRNSKSDLYVLNIFNWVYRMSVIEGQFWFPVGNTHSILILNPSISSKIKEISLTNIHTDMNPRSVHQTHSNEVLLAAKQGLYVLDIHGSYLYKVGGGVISDIAIDWNKAYAYNYSCNSVVTVGYSAGQWVVTSTFTASSSSRHPHNTITLVDNNIYITSFYSHTIQSYTTTGTFVNTYGVRGSTSPGQLNYPWLCGKDSQGSLLVCDQYNHRLQVLSPGGIWKVYVLDRVRYPFDVVVDTRGNLWVMWWEINTKKYKISKFSL